MVTDGRALEEVLFGPDGAASAISSDATLIDMSTVGPTSIASVAERLAPVPMLDAPVLGSVPSVESGTLVIFVGGDRDGVRPARRSALAARHAEVPGTIRLGRDVEARQQRGRHRGPRGRRRAPRADRPCGDRPRRRPRQPRCGSARLVDRALASAPDGRGPRLVLPSGLGAQGPRARVRRGRAERHRAHRRRGGRGPVRRGDRGGARRRGLRRGRPVPRQEESSHRGSRPCAYHPRREADPAARPRGPAERRLPAPVHDPADHAVGRRPVPGDAHRVDRVQPRGAEHDPRVRDRHAADLAAVLDHRPVHRRVHRPLVAAEDPRRRAAAAGGGDVAGAVRPEGGAGAVLRAARCGCSR